MIMRMDKHMQEVSGVKYKSDEINGTSSSPELISNGGHSDDPTNFTAEHKNSNFSNDTKENSIPPQNSSDVEPAADGNSADDVNGVHCSDIDVMTDAYRNATDQNKPLNFNLIPAERNPDHKINPFDSKGQDGENYLLSIKKRCKKKVGPRDKHLIKTPLTSQAQRSTDTSDTNINSNNNNITKSEDVDFSLNDAENDVLRDYLMCLYGEEAFTLVSNGDSADTSYCAMEDTSSSSNSEGYKTQSLKNKFDYRKDCTEKKPYICGICSKSFGQHSNIVLHMRSHTGEKPYVCDVCGKGFSGKSDLNRHKNIHSVVKKYWCEECQRGFNDNSGFRRHKLIYHSASSHKCHICPKSYLALKDLEKHLKTHLKKDKMLAASKNQTAKANNKMKADNEGDPEEPVVDDDSDMIVIEDSSPDNSNHTDTMTNGEPSPEEPDSTTKRDRYINYDDRHTLSSERPHQCEKCNFSCSKRSNLRKHVAYVHCVERCYKCDVCFKGFKSSWALKRHKQVHNEEKTYRCELCDKGFNDTGSFKYHMKTHLGEKPHSCDICAKSFVLKSDLKKHMGTHIKQIQVAAKKAPVEDDMEVLIQSDNSFLNLAAYVQSSGR